MTATKEQLIAFIEKNVLTPAENHPAATEIIINKVRATRMRLHNQVSAEKNEEFFWNAMATDKGIDSYHKIHQIDTKTFEDVCQEFKGLCGRNAFACPDMRIGRYHTFIRDIRKVMNSSI